MGAQKEKLYKMLIIGFYMDDGTYKKVSHFEFHLLWLCLVKLAYG
jgi:hypothetical protein